MANLKDILPEKALTFTRVIPVNPVLCGVTVESNLRLGHAKVTALEAGAFGVVAVVDGRRILIPWANVSSADLA